MGRLLSWVCVAASMVLSLVVIAPGCATLIDVDDGSCGSGGACAAGQSCVQDVCVTPCDTDADCAGNEACVSDACVSVQGAQCETDSDCVTPEPCEEMPGSCAAGSCEYPAIFACASCQSDDQCAAGAYCATDDTCQSQKSSAEACAADNECLSGSCDGSVCQGLLGQACLNDAGCTGGNVCTCGSADCAVSVCSLVDCGACGYTSDGVSCEGTVADAVACDDGIACTVGEACDGGLCLGGDGSGCAGQDGYACQNVDDCNSGLCECANAACSARICSAQACGACEFSTGLQCSGALDGTVSCDDGIDCTENDVCGGGGCAGTPNLNLCPAAAECEVMQCAAGADCVPEAAPAGTACSPDADPCSDDICNTGGACTHPARGNDRAVDPVDGHCYMLFDTELTWVDADQFCKDLVPAGYLATITTVEINDLLTPMIDPAGVTEWDTWVGLTDAAEEGTWVWITGEDFGFDGWRVGEPNNGTGGTPENCAIMEGDRTPVSWDDRSCANEYPFICERSQ